MAKASDKEKEPKAPKKEKDKPLTPEEARLKALETALGVI